MKNTTKNSSKIPPKFICEKCDYKCCKKGDFNKHLHSIKHNTTDTTNLQQEFLFSCECGKVYNHRASLYNHKKKCNVIIVTDSNAESLDKDKLIIMLINQNAELIKETSEFKNIMLEQQTMMMKVIENGTHNNNNNTNNSHNKAFNLNFFLNETCKDAMNIMDFVDSIKLQLSDLEQVGELGYVDGISNIIVKNLKDLDVTERPIRCTDKKREVLYVKDENKWEKEDEDKHKIKKVIKNVANKNIRLLQKFKEVHPDCGKSASKFSDQYNKIIVEAMGGSGDNDSEKEEKIIQKISKNVTIDKI